MDKFRGFNIQVNPDKPHVTVHRIKTVAEYGANCVRIQINDMESRLPDMEHPQEYEAWLTSKINAIAVASEAGKQFGVKLILSQHQPFGGTYKNWRGKLKHRLYSIDSYQDAFVEDWSRIAWEFADDQTIVGYDLLNEPLARARKYMPLMLRTARSIRVIDQTKKIIVSTPHGNPAKIKSLTPYVAEMKQLGKMWATVHMYWPMNITHQGVGRYKIGRRYPSMKVNSEQLQNYMAKVQLWRKQWRIPVFVGEFSCARWSGHPDCSNAYNYLNDITRIMDGYHMHWAYHAHEEAGIWRLDYPDYPCDPPENIHCVAPTDLTDRLQLMQNVLKGETNG